MSMRHVRTQFVFIGCIAVAASIQAQTPSFTVLGTLPDGQQCLPLALSDDGAVVVGYGGNVQGDFEAFKWTADGGMVGLGFYDEDTIIPLSSATSVTSDGAGVFGSSTYGFGFLEFAGVIWNPDGSMSEIGHYWDPYYQDTTQITDASGDGSVLIGISGDAVARCVPFRWTAEDGIQSLGELPGGYEVGHAEGISADGKVIVGGEAVFEYNLEAFRWTEEDGMVGLGMLPGAIESNALGVSNDGRTIVGYCEAEDKTEAFRWTKTGGMCGLGHLSGGAESSASATTADGRIVIGYGNNSDGEYGAFIWTADAGMRWLKDVMIDDLGLDVADWSIRDAIEISPDGKYIIGNGRDSTGAPQGWLLNVGDDPVCLGDFNGDGVRNISDLAELLSSYNVDDGGDMDGDGDTDLADLASLLAVYNQTCVW